MSFSFLERKPLWLCGGSSPRTSDLCLFGKLSPHERLRWRWNEDVFQVFPIEHGDFPASHVSFRMGVVDFSHNQPSLWSWSFPKPLRVWTPLLAAAEMAHLDTLQVLLDVTLIAIKKFGGKSGKSVFFLVIVHVSYSFHCSCSHGSYFVFFLWWL